MGTDLREVRVGKAECPSPHSWKNKAARVLWAVVWRVAFRTSPRVLHGWRRILLKLFGAKIGRNVRTDPTVRIWAPWNLELGDECSLGTHVFCYSVDHIRIGSHATVSFDVCLCTATHDVTDPHMRLVTAPICVEDQAWVCARAFIAPGVTIGQGAVAGACAVVTRNVPPWQIVVGNPAKFLKVRTLDN